MKLVVLFAVLVMCFCEVKSEKEQEETPAWANEKLFGGNQDAWASLKGDLNSTYYLLKSTYNNDSVWGEGFTCISANATLLNETAKTVTADIRYKNNNYTTLQTSHEIIQAIKMYNYSMENGIKYTVEQGGKNITFQDALVFTSEVCDIFYTSDGNYELWVPENQTKAVPPCCEFMFTYFALNKTIYNIYNENCTS